MQGRREGDEERTRRYGEKERRKDGEPFSVGQSTITEELEKY